MQTEVYKPGLASNKQLVKLLREFQRDPSSLVFVSLAEQYRQQGLFDQAIEICAEGLEQHPGLSSALLVQARCYFEQKKFANALDATAKIIAVNSENIRAHKLRSEIFTRLGQRGAAMTSLSLVLRLFPQDQEAQNSLAELRGLVESSKQPAPHPSRGRFSPPPSTGEIADFHVGALSVGMADSRADRRIESAEAQVEQLNFIEEEAEEPAIATKTIAELYLRQGLRPKALAVLRKMLKENPANAWARETLQELQSSGILLSTQNPIPGKKEKLERKLMFLERLLTRVQLSQTDKGREAHSF